MSVYVIQFKGSDGRWHDAGVQTQRFYDEAQRIVAKMKKANPKAEYRIL